MGDGVVGAYSGTPEDQIQLYRCGNFGYPGCGKILTEGQKMRHGFCPKCGSIGSVAYYPKTRMQMFKAYLLLLRTGEIWLRKSATQQTQSGRAKS